MWVLTHYWTRWLTLAELQVENPADTVSDVKALAPVEVLAYMLE